MSRKNFFDKPVPAEVRERFERTTQKVEALEGARDKKGRFTSPLFEGERFGNYDAPTIALIQLVSRELCTKSEAARILGITPTAFTIKYNKTMRIRNVEALRTFEKTMVVHTENTSDLAQRILVANIPIAEESAGVKAAARKLFLAASEPYDWAVVLISHPSYNDFAYMVRGLDEQAGEEFFGYNEDDHARSINYMVYHTMRREIATLIDNKRAARRSVRSIVSAIPSV